MPAGRPSDYREEYCDQVREYGKEGLSKAEIAVKLNIGKATLYRWIDNHEDFRDAIKDAEHHAEAWFARTFKMMGVGAYDKANATAMIFAAKNQLPKVFRDRKETELKGEVGIFEINFTGYDEETEEQDWDE